MANNYYSRLARKRPTPARRATRPPPRSRPSCMARDRPMGVICALALVGCIVVATSTRASASRTVSVVGQSFIALAAATFETSSTR
jgi:hypothetical protein